MKEILVIENLSKSYENSKVIDGVSLKIKKGEFICIIGASGCGKTTLLNLIGGFIQSDSGSIVLKNHEVVRPSKDCVMIFQEFDQLFPWKTLKKNVEFPLENSRSKIPSAERSGMAQKYIQMMKLQGFENYYPLQLSGGMKQRTAIARALVTAPEVLLMDEPFGSLDAQTKAKLQKTLKEVWIETGTTIVFVTHDVREALLLGDRIVIMKKGGISHVLENGDIPFSEKWVSEVTEFL